MVRIALPPLSEQQRMVEILQETEVIHRRRTKAEAKTAELIPAMFGRMFLTAKAREKWPVFTVSQAAAQAENSIRTGLFAAFVAEAHALEQTQTH